MKMTRQEVRDFIDDELMPMVRVSSPRALSTVIEDFEALEVAFLSGNNTLVFAMASYISQAEGLLNGTQIAQRITKQLFEHD